MAIQYTFTFADEILSVYASGFDESAEEVAAYGMAVIQAGREHDASRILCDERDLEYRLGIFDTYEVATALAAAIPSLVRVAIVCSPQFAADARLWEHVVSQHGLTVRVFFSVERATGWLADSLA